jgi:hypothetical protein
MCVAASAVRRSPERRGVLVGFGLFEGRGPTASSRRGFRADEYVDTGTRSRTAHSCESRCGLHPNAKFRGVRSVRYRPCANPGGMRGIRPRTRRTADENGLHRDREHIEARPTPEAHTYGRALHMSKRNVKIWRRMCGPDGI